MCIVNLIVVPLWICGIFHFAGAFAENFIDLSHAYNGQIVLFPGVSPPASFDVQFEGYKTEGEKYWYSSKSFCMSEHTGTHIDAPYHFFKNGKTLDQIPLNDMLDVQGVLIDVSDKVYQIQNGRLNVTKNYAVTREDIIEWEKVNGQIPPRSIVLVRSGWGSRWPDQSLYKGIDEPIDVGDNAKLNSPGFDTSAATFLTTERQILGVGIDTLSIDVGSTTNYPAHRVFASRNAYGLENVANLHLLPARGFRLWAAPLKLDAGTGAPTRLLAKIESKQKPIDNLRMSVANF